jgi:hypothetical protein
MFDSLDEQMKKNEDRTSTSAQRLLRYALYAVAGVLVFGGIIFGIYKMS